MQPVGGLRPCSRGLCQEPGCTPHRRIRQIFPLYHALHQGGHHSVVFRGCWCYSVKENEL